MKNPRTPPELQARARELRKNMTKAEVLLWQEMRKWAKVGIRMRRQHPVPPFIIDFAYLPKKIAIEIDGQSHFETGTYDVSREALLNKLGWRVIRFSNDEVLKNSIEVAKSIFDLVSEELIAHVPPPRRGKGVGQSHINQFSESKFTIGDKSILRESQIPANKIKTLLVHPALTQIRDQTKNTQYQNNLFLVGGAVRDALLNREPKNDLDIVTELDAQALAQSLDKRAQIYPRFGTAMIRVANTNIELITARKESYDATSRKPHTEPASLLDDALRRDFTCNTLLLNIHTGELIDPLGTGLPDLQRHILRTPLNPAETFHDDPLRMLRAVRFKHQLGFENVENLAEALTQESHRLSIISQERIRDEFTKILLGPNPDIALQELLDFGLLHTWAPELEALVGVEQGKWHYADVWTHTLHVVRNATSLSTGERLSEGQNNDILNLNKSTLLLAALLHDIAKPLTRSIDVNGQTRFFDHENVGAELSYTLCLRWRYSQETARDVSLLVKNHMRLSGIKKLSTPATRRIIRDLGTQLNNWIALIDADASALKKGVRKLDLTDLITKLAEVKTTQPKSNWTSPLTGEQIMQITGLPPSPEIGKLKSELENLVIEGQIPADDLEKAKDALQTILRNRQTN
jgi:poly(A) polymerase